MAKRTNRKRPAPESLAQPTTWRLQHGEFAPPQRAVDPETGRMVTHRTARDLLATLEANGTISPGMHTAGQTFRAQFRAAGLDTIRTSKFALTIAGTSVDTLPDRTMAARTRVGAVLELLGGQHSSAGSCLWHVVGCELSIREWATRQGWGGRPVGHAQAQGILVATLAVLEAHYRRPPRRSQ